MLRNTTLPWEANGGPRCSNPEVKLENRTTALGALNQYLHGGRVQESGLQLYGVTWSVWKQHCCGGTTASGCFPNIFLVKKTCEAAVSNELIGALKGAKKSFIHPPYDYVALGIMHAANTIIKIRCIINSFNIWFHCAIKMNSTFTNNWCWIHTITCTIIAIIRIANIWSDWQISAFFLNLLASSACSFDCFLTWISFHK